MLATPVNKAIAIWHRRLASAMRMSVACTMVALSTLYAPHLIRCQVAYPAFSYATAVLLIVYEATLGDTLRGTWHALIGTSLVMGPSMACLWLIRSERFTRCLAALAVALAAFGLAIMESTPILAKRIAFGQTVIVYVGAVVLGEKTDVVMHPVHVAASTGVGAMSSILAMLIPFPRLANFEIKRSCKSYAENATQRLNLLMKAIISDDQESSEEANHFISQQIKSLSSEAPKLLQSIKRHQDAIFWEKPHLRLRSSPRFNHQAQKLQQVEINFQALEIAFTSHQSLNPKNPLEKQLKNELQKAAKNLCSRINQIEESSSPPVEIIQISESLAMENANLPVLFMIWIMNNSLYKPQYKSKGIDFRKIVSKRNTKFAIKCSLSLGLAVFLGLYYTKENGYWSGLTIAISFARNRQATFTATNSRAQGTALGSVYGVLGYLISHECGILKLAILLPWIVFTTFLRDSKMYGEPGSLSAIIAALLILGRRDYGTPSEFAIARLIEAFIGLSCFVLVEVLIQPQRAAGMVRTRVWESLKGIDGLLEEINEERRKGVSEMIDELERLVEEAIVEPKFWFSGFPGDCYVRLVESVRRMVRSLCFMADSMEGVCLPEVYFDVEMLKGEIRSVLGRMEEAMRGTDMKGQDTEMGKEVTGVLGIDEEKAEIIMSCFLQRARDWSECGQVMGDSEAKKRMVVSMGSVAFCMRCLVAETVEIGKILREILG